MIAESQRVKWDVEGKNRLGEMNGCHMGEIGGY